MGDLLFGDSNVNRRAVTTVICNIVLATISHRIHIQSNADLGQELQSRFLSLSPARHYICRSLLSRHFIMNAQKRGHWLRFAVGVKSAPAYGNRATEYSFDIGDDTFKE